MTRNRYPGVYKRGSSWHFRAQFGDGKDRTSVSGGGYQSAREAYDAKVEAVRNARPMQGVLERPDATLTLAAWLDAWVAEHTSTLRPGTAVSYRSKVNRVKDTTVAGKRLRALTGADYRRLVMELRAQAPAHSTLMLKLTILTVALDAAVRAGAIVSHPLREITVSRTDEKFEARPWKVTEARTFLAHRDAAGDPLYLCWHLALVTGMRRGELHGLQWRDVDLDTGVLRVRRQRIEAGGRVFDQAPKTTTSEAPVVLDAGTVALLRQAPRVSEYVITDPRSGRPYAAMNTFGVDFQRACRAAGVPEIRFHDLRHTAASLLAEAGVPLHLAKRRLRHWSQAMTEHYTHAIGGLAADAEAAEQLSSLLQPPEEAA